MYYAISTTSYKPKSQKQICRDKSRRKAYQTSKRDEIVTRSTIPDNVHHIELARLSESDALSDTAPLSPAEVVEPDRSISGASVDTRSVNCDSPHVNNNIGGIYVSVDSPEHEIPAGQIYVMNIRILKVV